MFHPASIRLISWTGMLLKFAPCRSVHGSKPAVSVVPERWEGRGIPPLSAVEPLNPGPIVLQNEDVAHETITPLALRNSLLEDILSSRGFAPKGRLRQLLEPIVSGPMDRFIRIAYEFDRRAELFGFMQASRWMLTHFANGVEVIGAEQVPVEGPLLVVADHPGAFDELAIAALLHRSDLRILADRHTLLTSLPSVARTAIFSSEHDIHDRMKALRTSIKTLREGGTLLLFPTGRTDPDPRFTAGASEAIAGWSSSVEFLVNKAPETQIVVTLVSGVVSPVALRNPVAWMRRQPLEQQKLAILLQMALQLAFPRLFNVVPRITFSPAQTVAELTADGMQSVQEAIVAHAQQLLDLHAVRQPIFEPVLVRA